MNDGILKVIILSALAVVLLASSPSVVSAESDAEAKPTRIKKELLLFAKNPATWSIVKGGGNAKIIYYEATGAFALNAAGLTPRSAYALIRYADEPPRVEILARGMSDVRGRLVLTGIWRNWTRKFWVVSGEDVAGSEGNHGSLKAWRPDRYLFEEKPLGVPCACPEPEKPQ